MATRSRVPERNHYGSFAMELKDKLRPVRTEGDNRISEVEERRVHVSRGHVAVLILYGDHVSEMGIGRQGLRWDKRQVEDLLE